MLYYITNCKDVYQNDISVLVEDDLILMVNPNLNDLQINAKLDQAKAEAKYELIDGKGWTLMPGIIDLHVHFRDPGLTHKEDLRSGSMAACKGGITTFMDMPNTEPNTISYQALQDKKAIARKKSIVNWGLHFGASKSNNLDDLDKVIAHHQGRTTKVFLNCSTGNMMIEDDQLLAQVFQHTPLVLAHAEHEMIDKVIKLNQNHGTGVYICHIPSQEEFDKVKQAKLNPQISNPKHPVYAEITPHHLFLNMDHRRANARDDQLLRMKPELREQSDNEYLIKMINEGFVDTIGTDHAPHLLEEKLAQLTWGMVGIETSLSLMLTLVAQGKISLPRVQELMCENPARIVGIKGRGKIAPNYYADLILVDLNQTWTVTKDELLSKCGWSPYEGWNLTGRNQFTMINGQIVYQNNQIITDTAGREIEYEY